jgi:mycothiol synthase
MAKSRLAIRPVGGADVGELVALWNRVLVRDTVNVARFVQWLFLDPDFDVVTGEGAWVAEEGGEIVGFIRAIKRVYPNDMAGTEDEHGWIPAVFVAPERQHRGVGAQLLERATAHFRARGTKQIWVCGNTGSAPGYLFPGVDKDAYASGLKFFTKHGFAVDHEPVAMSRPLIDFEYDRHHAEAWAEGTNEGVRVEPVRAETVAPFLAFLRQAFPGDWNIAARAKLKTGAYDQVLLAWLGDEVVGYCQWDGEHFGPFGVKAEVRGKRLGAKLFVEACRRIRAADGRSVWFNWADDDAARFYRRFGLEATRRFAILRRDL